MKIKDGFLLREVAKQYVVVPVGSRTLDFNGMITLNRSGKFLFELLQKEISKEDLVKELRNRYEIDEATAVADVEAFLETLQEHHLLECYGQNKKTDVPAE